MIHYKVSTVHPHRHFITLEALFPVDGRNELILQLPSWRPGRYELGNFAKNIRGWKVTSAEGKELTFEKTSKDTWRVATTGLEYIKLNYQYYAAELNAGSSFLDEEQLYINPVNCFFYDASNPNQTFEIDLLVPSNYRVATGLKKLSEHRLLASSFDELADCPLIASATLKHLEYTVQGVNFHCWLQGDVNLNELRFTQDLKLFTQTQFDMFGDIPCAEYHFLFHFVPYFLRHGVEHSNSTVIAMGPAADFQQEHLYKDLLGISCHELFHTWNVKNIRPVEMMPYDFTRENYSQQGYVYEGVTTYYGDLLLWRAGILSDDEWLDVIHDHIQDYVNNHGRTNLSVADSSWDTWLDGYVAGIPWRKVSIYNEGFLIALMCDLIIMNQSSCAASLDTALRSLYNQFGKQCRGYSGDDYLQLLNACSEFDFTELFESLVHGNSDYVPHLRDALGLAGVELQEAPSAKWSESTLGLSLDEANQKVVVSAVVPDSPADEAGLWYSDEIVAVNGIAPYKNIQHLLRLYANSLELTVLRKGKRTIVQLAPDGKSWVVKYRCARETVVTPKQVQVWNHWMKGMRFS
jgi:predicted metalloprotease with PDZ domain